jgi:hypothetical protein
VRPDADLDYTVAELVDGTFIELLFHRDHPTHTLLGAMFNSGQSCCSIEARSFQNFLCG